MRPIRFYHPRELVFGNGCLAGFTKQFIEGPLKKPFILADPHILPQLQEMLRNFKEAGIPFELVAESAGEPTVSYFRQLRVEMEKSAFDSVIGIGGGSVLDTAKLLAALCYSSDEPEDVFGIGKIRDRNLYLACLPSTAGTGSEVSPNAVLLDESENLKKGIVSPFLVPDAAFVDPELTHSVPPAVTASTGIDALTHCLEAFANKFEHPVTDLYALKGIELIYGALEEACSTSPSANARSDVALGSLYGGICLGPVNTAAVHALSYPLGGEYHIPHGISNAMLLPHVMRMNLPEAAGRYAMIARTIGVATESEETAQAIQAIDAIHRLCRNVGIPESLQEFNITVDAVPGLAHSAYSVKRLLNNNPRDLTPDEISQIYKQLF
jgi:alcohol dehydrogenase class IV